MKKPLNEFEQEIEKSAESFRPVSKKQLRKIEGVLAKLRKARNINIRISESVLSEWMKKP